MGKPDNVSILVFLEVPLQQDIFRKELEPYREFQSLFFWKFHCNFDNDKLSSIAGAFQSLFFWKFHCNLITELQKLLVMRFNPCFSGSSTATRYLHHVLNNHLQGFNPCFSGSSTATFQRLSLRGSVLKFQSLFFWKFHCNYR